jgi:hypothetical protein
MIAGWMLQKASTTAASSRPSFNSYERWREAKDGIFLPRIQGVINYLQPLVKDHPDVAAWIEDHPKVLERAFMAVASIYADDVLALEKKILGAIDGADEDWGQPGTLSRKAIRALASTKGVSSVLVGMRKKVYVEDVLNELKSLKEQSARTEPWRRLQKGLAGIFPEYD